MSFDQTHLTIASSIALASLTEAPVEVRFGGVTVAEDVTADITLSWETWRRCLEGGLFHLDGTPQPPGFQKGREVVMRLRLRPALRGSLPNDEAGLVAALVGDGAAARHTEAWLATEVLQAVDLPDDLSEATLELGARTSWGAESSPRQAPMDLIKHTLEAKGWAYHHVDEAIVGVDVELDSQRCWRMLVRVSEQAPRFRIYGVHPRLMPPPTRPRAALLLAQLNYDTGIGAFEMDTEDGEIRVRTTAEATRESFGDALRDNVAMMAEAFWAIASM